MTQRSRNSFILGFGSNATPEIGPNAALLKAAVARCNAASLKVEVISGIWRTPAFPPGSGPDFANACALASGAFGAQEALAIVHRIEADMGRVRAARWGQRVIDIDLLAMAGAVLPDGATWQYWHDLPAADQQRLTPPQLILPHPRLQDRAFVLVPMAEVAPDWVHPVLGKTVVQMLADLDPAQTAGMATI